MKFNLEHSPGNLIQSYSADGINVVLGNPVDAPSNSPTIKTISVSMILTPSLLIEGWIATEDALSQTHLNQILETQPEIIVLGTGERIIFPDPVLLTHCHQAGVGMEVMDTGAACRTYNILASEGRKVCAAFVRI